MGNRGEKQKKKPKYTDKKQSERFKETAREVGADQESPDALRVLDQLIGSRGPSLPTGKPTTLISVNSGAVATLADGTAWRLAMDGWRAARWIGANVIVVEDKTLHNGWHRALVNLDIDDRVAVVGTSIKV